MKNQKLILFAGLCIMLCSVDVSAKIKTDLNLKGPPGLVIVVGDLVCVETFQLTQHLSFEFSATRCLKELSFNAAVLINEGEKTSDNCLFLEREQSSYKSPYVDVSWVWRYSTYYNC